MSDDRVVSGWGWVRLVPPSTWQIPDEIKGPTGVPPINLFIVILTSEIVGNDVIEAVGELIAEDARFNVWYGTEVDGRVAPEVQAGVYAGSRDVVERIYEPWSVFRDAEAAASAEIRRAGRYDLYPYAEYNAFLEALRAARQTLADLRHGLGSD